ncbi:MAG: hypothetical protein ACK56F_19835 [bacterium]
MGGGEGSKVAAATPAAGTLTSEATKAQVVREITKGAEATSWRKTR